MAAEKKLDVPILQCHGELQAHQDNLRHTSASSGLGDQDPIIQLVRSRRSEDLFRRLGFRHYTFKQYDGLVHTNSEQVRLESVDHRTHWTGKADPPIGLVIGLTEPLIPLSASDLQ